MTPPAESYMAQQSIMQNEDEDFDRDSPNTQSNPWTGVNVSVTMSNQWLPEESGESISLASVDSSDDGSDIYAQEIDASLEFSGPLQ
jgi:hypothetical protein